MEILHKTYFETPLIDWLIAAAQTCVVSIFLVTIRRIVLKRARRWAERTETRLDDIFVGLLASLRTLFFVAIGLWVGAEYVRFGPGFQHTLRTGVALLTLFQVGLSLQAGVRGGAERWAGAGTEGEAKMAAAATSFLASLSIWALVIISGLSAFGFQISALLAGLGVGGVAAALAVQSILGDLFASLSIYFDRPFHIGDFIVTGTEMGTVERIGLRTTRVRSLGGEEIIFANGDLTKSRIRNYRKMAERARAVRIRRGIRNDAGRPSRNPQPRQEHLRSAVKANAKTDCCAMTRHSANRVVPANLARRRGSCAPSLAFRYINTRRASPSGCALHRRRCRTRPRCWVEVRARHGSLVESLPAPSFAPPR
jgi:small-conductance mechanosensitive channel